MYSLSKSFHLFTELLMLIIFSITVIMDSVIIVINIIASLITYRVKSNIINDYLIIYNEIIIII